jgi:hypothetical protein
MEDKEYEGKASYIWIEAGNVQSSQIKELVDAMIPKLSPTGTILCCCNSPWELGAWKTAFESGPLEQIQAITVVKNKADISKGNTQMKLVECWSLSLSLSLIVTISLLFLGIEFCVNSCNAIRMYVCMFVCVLVSLPCSWCVYSFHVVVAHHKSKAWRQTQFIDETSYHNTMPSYCNVIDGYKHPVGVDQKV